MSDGTSGDRVGTRTPSTEGIRALAQLCSRAGVEEIEATDGHRSIRLRLDLALAPTAFSAQLDAEANQAGGGAGPHLLISQWVGVFHRGPEPEGEAELFARQGQTVVVGDVIGVVEAMQLQHEVQADRSGTLVRFLVEDGTPVEYGQPLAEIA